MKPPQWLTAASPTRPARASRKLAVGAALAAVVVAAAPPTGAQAQTPDGGPPAPYVVLMAADPAVTEHAPQPGEPIDSSDPEVRTYVEDLEQEQDAALAAADIPGSAKRESFTYAVNGFSAALTAEQAGDLAKQPDVVSVERDELRQLHTDASPSFLGLDGRRGAWESGYTGEGVVLGVIDTGIWPEHPSFADDGTYSAPPADWMGGEVACEFGDTDYNPDDAPFDCNNKLVGARDMRTLYKEFGPGPELYNSARDYNGHGTHTASTAGGNRDVEAEVFDVPRGTVSGIAPRAHVAMYSACGDNGCFSGDLADAIDAAVADGVDVINYSIGGGAGLTGPDDIAFLNANDAGVFVATSAGNSGPGAGTVGSPANDPWLTGVAAATHDRTFEGSVTLGDGTELVGPTATNGTDEVRLVDAADHGNELCDPEVTFEPEVTGAIVVCTRGEFLLTEKSQTVHDQGGAGMVLADHQEGLSQPLAGYWVPSVHLDLAEGETVKAYIDEAGEDAVAAINAGEAVPAQGSVTADFSSRGPNVVAESLIKPDVSAPGVGILAGYTPTPLSSPAGNLFQVVNGTSMASPHVAGVLALLKQAHPDWTPAMAQSAVMTTARQDVFKEDGSTEADPFDMGSGYLDPGRKANRPNSVFDPGLVYDAGFNDYLGFLCDAAPEVFADPDATCEALAGAGFPTTVENLNYPSIGMAEVAGVTEVQRTITSVADRRAVWVPKVEQPDGFDVEVSPRWVKLDPGESATVTIRITNVSAPLDEWQFGSLTWKGGRYEARSPIAVKGVALGAPAEVTGAGADGESSFDVQFGYDGSYTAAAHGLVPETGITGSVDQDPDQTFDPADPAGTTAHELELAGAGHLRLALTTEDLAPADPNIDIDLYLLNSAGDLVGTSTQGGTDEQIDLSLPADDTYTLYVHGWQTLDQTVDYTLASWQVPLEPDTGPLSVVSAPEEAASGESGTVEIAWSGLDPATSYLGAVSHSGPDGLLDLTLVAVSTD